MQDDSASAQPHASAAVRSKKPRLRWWIVWTLFFSTVINYISRQSFSVLAPVIAAQLHLTHTGLSEVFSAFQVAYAVTWLAGGIFLDIVGTRVGLALAAGWWSLMNMLTGLASSVVGFAFFRFMVGVGEGFNWPGASKVVAEWFPREERSLAVAIFDSGSSVGGALAALLIPLLALAVGWRYAFVLSGLIGFIWLAVWLRVYFPLHEHPRVTKEEIHLIDAGRDAALSSGRRGARRWLVLLKDRNVWGVVAGRSLTDPIWWFYVFWLPQYLSDARGFTLKQIAAFAWIPFVAADIGNFTGGLIAGYCIRRGVPVIRARKWVCVVSCLPILAGIPAASVHSVYLAIGLICFALWGYASWSTMGLTFPSDLFTHDVVASVTGLSGLGAGGVSTAFTLLVGALVDHFSSYRAAFVIAGVLPLFATLSVLVLIRPAQQIKQAATTD
jgi:ACS family hexuronate transporter-like MFS transporter